MSRHFLYSTFFLFFSFFLESLFVDRVTMFLPNFIKIMLHINFDLCTQIKFLSLMIANEFNFLRVTLTLHADLYENLNRFWNEFYTFSFPKYIFFVEITYRNLWFFSMLNICVIKGLNSLYWSYCYDINLFYFFKIKYALVMLYDFCESLNVIRNCTIWIMMDNLSFDLMYRWILKKRFVTRLDTIINLILVLEN